MYYNYVQGFSKIKSECFEIRKKQVFKNKERVLLVVRNKYCFKCCNYSKIISEEQQRKEKVSVNLEIFHQVRRNI